jgi:hypothetical protein
MTMIILGDSPQLEKWANCPNFGEGDIGVMVGYNAEWFQLYIDSSRSWGEDWAMPIGGDNVLDFVISSTPLLEVPMEYVYVQHQTD